MYGNNKPVSRKYCEINWQVRSSEGNAYVSIACSLAGAILFLISWWPKGDEGLDACITPISDCSIWFPFTLVLVWAGTAQES